MTDLLLTTKLNLPPLRAEIISRSHLVERLDDGLLQNGKFGRRLTLISAPAGYGKSTLAIDWVNRFKLPINWLSLDEADNDPRRFITYLIAALQQMDKSVGQAASAMLQSPQPPPDELMLTALVNEIAAASREQAQGIGKNLEHHQPQPEYWGGDAHQSEDHRQAIG